MDKKEKNIYMKEYRKKNSVYLKKYRKENYFKYKDKSDEYKKQWYQKNKEEIKQKRTEYYLKNKEKILNSQKKYNIKNKENRKKYIRDYNVNRRKNDITFRLIHSLRRRLNGALKGKNKNNSIKNLIGCDGYTLKLHLEKQFNNGMSWDNYGIKGWHIDHIVPCASFNLSNPKHQKQCFHYTNLQPLWWWENLSKGNKNPHKN